MCPVSKEGAVLRVDGTIPCPFHSGISLLMDFQPPSLNGVSSALSSDVLLPGLLLCLSGVPLCRRILPCNIGDNAGESAGKAGLWREGGYVEEVVWNPGRARFCMLAWPDRISPFLGRETRCSIRSWICLLPCGLLCDLRIDDLPGLRDSRDVSWGQTAEPGSETQVNGKWLQA